MLAVIFWSAFVLLVNAQEKDKGEYVQRLIDSRRLLQEKEKELPQLVLPEATTSYKDVEGVGSKDEWDKRVKTPLVKRYKDGSVAEKKFSARIGYGNAYKLGAKIDGEKMEGGFGLNNSPALTVKLGYSLSKYVEIQGDVSRATNFGNSEKWSDSYGYGYTSEWSNQVIISAYTANLKLTIPILLTDKTTFSPYIFGGLGRATYKAIYKGKESYDGIQNYYAETTRYSGNSLKVGGGVDIKVYKNISLFSEYNYQEIRFMIDDIKITVYHSQVVGGIGLKF